MRNDILIIVDQLVEPPTDFMAFRTVTMIAHCNLHLPVLLHTTQSMKDMYYHFMKPRGLLDFVEDLINETENEDGIRLDVIATYPRTIITKSIRFENQINILGQIKWLTSI
jgi:hypothetical protein